MRIFTSISFIIFTFAYAIVTFILLLAFAPFSSSFKLTNSLTSNWCRVMLFFLKHVNRVSHEIIDADKVPDEPCLIACKHQSMWDTIIFHVIFDSPAYVYKKELHKIPFYGWYIKRIKMVPIDRNGSAKTLKEMIVRSKNVLFEQNRKLIIFPQGTRTPIESSTKDYPYQIGVAALYKSLNVKVVPVALNSGKFWGKKNYIKDKGTITLKFLDPIEPGLDKKEFMQILEDRIEGEKLSNN